MTLLFEYLKRKGILFNSVSFPTALPVYRADFQNYGWKYIENEKHDKYLVHHISFTDVLSLKKVAELENDTKALSHLVRQTFFEGCQKTLVSRAKIRSGSFFRNEGFHSLPVRTNIVHSHRNSYKKPMPENIFQKCFSVNDDFKFIKDLRMCFLYVSLLDSFDEVLITRSKSYFSIFASDQREFIERVQNEVAMMYNRYPVLIKLFKILSEQLRLNECRLPPEFLYIK